MNRDLLLKAALAEMERGEHLNGIGYTSMHEGFAVLLEEVEELKAHVWMRAENRDMAAMREEAIQVAAVAMRIAEETLKPRHRTR